MINSRRIRELRSALDPLLEGEGPRAHLPDDPVALVRAYSRPDDREVVALIAASLAYGRVAAVRNSIRAVFADWGTRPAAALRAGRHREPDWAPGFRHRWTDRRDVQGLLEAVRQIWVEEGSLGAALAARIRDSGDSEDGLALWVRDLRVRARSAVDPTPCAPRAYPDDGAPPPGRSAPERGLHFLLADPAGSSACKRLRLFLRWMIRPDDGIDLGLWSGLIDPAHLVVPLDAHWARIGPRLGLCSGRRPDGRMAREITLNLRRIRPEDPLVYDFPVCHFGIHGGCPSTLRPADCADCALRAGCSLGRRRIASGTESTRMQDPSTPAGGSEEELARPEAARSRPRKSRGFATRERGEDDPCAPN